MAIAAPHPSNAAVIGGGPAGLMAAEELAAAGFRVTVYEHRPSPGRKFMLAGRGGLNITHSEPLELFLERYGPERGFLEPALRAFDNDDLRAWCDELDEPTFVGSSGRVFPKSFKATPLLRAWLGRLFGLGVEFRLRHRWQGWVPGSDGRHLQFVDADEHEVQVSHDVVVFALGGASWPRVGSDGGWVGHFVDRGIVVTPLRPTNCGVRVAWSDVMIDRFAGTPLKNVALKAGDQSVRGDVIVTKSGLEGGPVYAHSRAVRAELDADGRSILGVDLQPDLTFSQLWERLEQRRRPKDSLSTLLRRSGFDPVGIGLMREAMGNDLPTSEMGLASLAKLVPVLVTSLMPIDRAISTAGGISVDELDEDFMLKRLPGVFVAGEMIDWEAPTGGYLMQASMSTGLAAGRGAAKWSSTSG
jgi:uncharacterized flavoprotein (TIGR03862 family)